MMPTQPSAPGHSPIWHARSLDEALRTLFASASTGLSREEAARRLAQYGRNSLPAPKRRGPWLRLALQFHNPLIYVLLAAGAITFGLNDYVDTWVIVGVVLINAVIGFIQEGKAEKALEAVSALLSSRATVLREGARHEIDADREVAAVRHRLAGRSNACEIPPPEIRERLI